MQFHLVIAAVHYPDSYGQYYVNSKVLLGRGSIYRQTFKEYSAENQLSVKYSPSVGLKCCFFTACVQLYSRTKHIKHPQKLLTPVESQSSEEATAWHRGRQTQSDLNCEHKGDLRLDLDPTSERLDVVGVQTENSSTLEDPQVWRLSNTAMVYNIMRKDTL